ncbi:hypothetical protein B0H13DRAFT_1889642 [Mycena leptocephala]|nr:hypothetical protein B0H13DRAFT_1889642 [Mycena leptocephala]
MTPTAIRGKHINLAVTCRAKLEPPTSQREVGEKRWVFKCRHCNHPVTFKRTVKRDALFGDEKPAPQLGNLATHLRKEHKGIPPLSNVRPSEKNFLKIFAAWVIEDDLAFALAKQMDVKSKIAISEDTWIARAMTFTFAGTIGSWINSEWELVERVLDFHPIEDKEREGEYAAIGLAQTSADLEVLEKMSPHPSL